jgi:hypothetical protein
MLLQKKRRRRVRGAVVAETAVVSVLVMLLAFAFLEISRAAMVSAVLFNAARAGARAGSLSVGNYADIEQAALQVVRASHLFRLPTDDGGPPFPSPLPGTMTVSIDGTLVDGPAAFDGLVQRGTAIEVRIEVPYASVAWLPGVFWLAPDLVLWGSATAYREP